jgi:hypothetical protein
MKKFIVLFSITLMTSVCFGQDSIQKRECQRLIYFVKQELQRENYANATMYYLKGEQMCGDYDSKRYKKVAQVIMNTIATEEDAARQQLYTDTLIALYDRMEKQKIFPSSSYTSRATSMVSSTSPDAKRIDTEYLRGFENKNTFRDADVVYYYFNLYNLFSSSSSEEKAQYKKRLITDYFTLSKKVDDDSMDPSTLDNLNYYFDFVVKTCDDIIPELNSFMSSLPQGKEAKKSTVNNFLSLLEKKGCTQSDEYEMLIDTIISVDNTVDAVLAKAQLLRIKKKFDASISVYRDAMEMIETDSLKNDILMTVLDIQYGDMKRYNTAYNTAFTVKGSNKSRAMLIAADCVAKTANNCGASTFNRKCNYYYAAQLALKAGNPGAAEKYKANAPSSDEIFNNNSPSTVTLECWGVTVDVK